MKDRVEFGEFLKTQREKAGKTQADLAKRLGYSSAQYISNIERGLCAMPLASVVDWAQQIKMKPTELFRVRSMLIQSELEAKFKKIVRN